MDLTILVGVVVSSAVVVMLVFIVSSGGRKESTRESDIAAIEALLPTISAAVEGFFESRHQPEASAALGAMIETTITYREALHHEAPRATLEVLARTVKAATAAVEYYYGPDIRRVALDENELGDVVDLAGAGCEDGGDGAA